MSTTLADLQTAITASSLRTSAADVTLSTAIINDGYIDVCLKCNLGLTNVTKNLVANQTKYSITTDFSLTGVLAIRELRYIQSGASANFSIVPAKSLRDVLDLNSAAVTGFTRAYAFEGTDTLMLGPAPATGDTITLYYVPAPTALAAAGDVPSVIMSQWQERLLVTYGLFRFYELEDNQQAEAYEAKYDRLVAKFQRDLVGRQGATARGTNAGYPSRPNKPFHDRSTYVSGGI